MVVYVCLYGFFFFKQKTAYEMRISDWSSDVCSSDLWRGAWKGGKRQFNENALLAEANARYIGKPLARKIASNLSGSALAVRLPSLIRASFSKCACVRASTSFASA